MFTIVVDPNSMELSCLYSIVATLFVIIDYSITVPDQHA